MANGLLDLLGGAIGTTPPAYLEGLLGQNAVEDLRKRSIGSGLVNALVGYAAMPKNQNLGLGRILAGAAQAGMQGAQGVYDTATQDYMMQQKLDEMNRAKQLQTKRDQFIASIGQPNATREVVTQDTMQEPVPMAADALSPSYQTQLPVPTTTQEQYYNPELMMKEALQSGAIDLKDYLTLETKKKQGTQLLSNRDLEQLKTSGIELPTDRGQKYQRDLDTGKIDLIQGTLAPEKPTFKVGDIQEFKSGDNTITREYQGNNNWKIIGKSSSTPAGQDSIDYLTPQAQLGLAKVYLQTGQMPPIGSGKSAALMRANIYNMVFQLQKGKMTDDQIVAGIVGNKQNRAAEQQTLKSFSGGIEGRSVRAMNTATDHLFTLEEAGNALKNGDIRMFNSIGNKINKEIGVAAPVSFDGVKKIVAGEIVKATTGAAGALGDREEVQRSIDSANSPEQLLDQINYYKKLMAGQLQSLELQFITGTNRKSNEFRQRLSPKTKTLLPPAADSGDEIVTPLTSATQPQAGSGRLPTLSSSPSEKGWVLKVDKATGVRAYVNPKNTTQYRIVE